MLKIQIISSTVAEAKMMLDFPRKISHVTKQHSNFAQEYPTRENACRENKELYHPQDIRMQGKGQFTESPLCRLSRDGENEYLSFQVKEIGKKEQIIVSFPRSGSETVQKKRS